MVGCLEGGLSCSQSMSLCMFVTIQPGHKYYCRQYGVLAELLTCLLFFFQRLAKLWCSTVDWRQVFVQQNYRAVFVGRSAVQGGGRYCTLQGGVKFLWLLYQAWIPTSEKLRKIVFFPVSSHTFPYFLSHVTSAAAFFIVALEAPLLPKTGVLLFHSFFFFFCRHSWCKRFWSLRKNGTQNFHILRFSRSVLF